MTLRKIYMSSIPEPEVTIKNQRDITQMAYPLDL